jgi:hypothetical protein
MGIFGDIGRSNVGQVGQTMFNDVLKYKQMERQDNMDTLTAAHTAQQMDIAQRGLAMQEAEAARKAKIDAEREADLNRTVDLTVHPAYLSMPDPQKAEALKFFSSNGYTDANGRGRKVDVLNGVAAIEKTKGLFSDFLGPVVAAKKQAVVDSWTELQDATRSGDQKKIDTAQSNYDRTKMAYQASSDGFYKHLNKLDEIDAQSKTRQGWKVVQSDESPTGWAYQHPTTDEVIEGSPAPRDYGADTLYRSATLEERIRHNQAAEAAAAGKPDWKPKPTDRKALDVALTDFYGNMVMDETDRMAGVKLTPGQVYQKMTPTLRDHKQKVSNKAWDIYSSSGGAVTPSDAVAQAWDAVPFRGGNPSASQAAPSAPPTGFRDSGRTSGGKKVFISADGKNAWVSP